MVKIWDKLNKSDVADIASSYATMDYLYLDIEKYVGSNEFKDVVDIVNDTNTLKNKINVIRVELSKEMSKSGKNTYSKYDYFQLKDFMPRAIALMNEYGVYAEYQMVREKFELPSKKITQSQFDENGVKIGEIVTEEENFEYREVAIRCL